MIRLNYFATIFILTSLIACKPKSTALFNVPQPVDTKNISKFPKHLQGQFISVADSSLLLISDKIIQRIYDYDSKIHQNELDSTSQLSGNTIIDFETNTSTPIKRDGDSLVFHVHYIDTLFQMNYDNVVRKYKGYYFLNTRYDKTSWEVKKMQLSKGMLIISSISTEIEIKNLTKILENPNDSIPPYKFSATKKQFKEFVKNNGFSLDEIYIKQKKKTTKVRRRFY